MNKKFRIILISLGLLVSIITSIDLYFNKERPDILLWFIGVNVGIFLTTLINEIKRKIDEKK